MYLFEPSLLQIVMAVVAALAAAFLAAWLVAGAAGSAADGEDRGQRAAGPPGDEQEELDTRQTVIIWTAAGAGLLFLLWWATLSTGSGGQPPL